MTVTGGDHMCAYPDTACTSGYRYAETAGSQLSRACTPATTPQDPKDPPEGW